MCVLIPLLFPVHFGLCSMLDLLRVLGVNSWEQMSNIADRNCQKKQAVEEYFKRSCLVTFHSFECVVFLFFFVICLNWGGGEEAFLNVVYCSHLSLSFVCLFVFPCKTTHGI